jgi:hypothetical protein
MAMLQILAALPVLAGTLFLCSASAISHDWYPMECCHAQDCAPVDKATWSSPISEGKRQLIVTSKHGTATVPLTLPVRESKDGRMHVCMRPSLYGGMGVICLFAPSAMY